MLHQLSTIGKPFYEQFLSRVKLKVNLLNTQATLQVCFERQAFFSGKVAVFDPASDRFVQEFVGHTDCVHSMKLIWPCQLRHQEACHTDARIDASWTDIPTVAKMKRTPCDPKECLVQKWLRALGQIFHAFCLSIYASIDISCFKAEHCPKTSQTSPRCHAKMCSQALLTLMCVCVCLLVCMCVCVSHNSWDWCRFWINAFWGTGGIYSKPIFFDIFCTAHEILRRRTKAGSPEGRLWADLCLSSIDEWRGAAQQMVPCSWHSQKGTFSTARQGMQSQTWNMTRQKPLATGKRERVITVIFI